MYDLILWSVILGLSLFLLIKASDYFITYSEKIGVFFGLPCFVIGIIILALGTSLPELVSSIVAVMKNSSEIVMGNVIGSNIANILLILGFIAYISNGFKLNNRCIKVDLIMLFSSTIILLVLSLDKIITLYEGIFLLVLITIYILYSTLFNKKSVGELCTDIKDGHIIKNSIILLVSCYLIYLGSEWTIKSVISLSDILQIPKEFIAITVVAVGTSLPELIVSASALKKGSADMALGNIIGSCVFNSLGIVGASALFGNIAVTKNILTFAFPVLFLAIFMLTINNFKTQISRFSGGVYLGVYFAFIVALYFIK